MSVYKCIRNNITGLFTNKHVFIFLNGFLLATALYCYIEDSYEKRLFEIIASHVRQQGANSKEELMLAGLHLTHSLGIGRTAVFVNREINTIKTSMISPVTFDLMTANGACGSYALVLSRLLNELGIQNRIAQMKVNSTWGGHMVVEARTDHGWAVLDPLYDLYFKNHAGRPASFRDLQHNWAYYSKQVPQSYDHNYRYQDVRYTNWEKIPVLMPFLKKLGYFFLGRQKTDGYSLRTILLRKFHIFFQITIFLHILLLLIASHKYTLRMIKNIRIYIPDVYNSNHPKGVVNQAQELA